MKEDPQKNRDKDRDGNALEDHVHAPFHSINPGL
jgi:hypothetical protein